jgi:hypothetical protein
MVGLMKLLFTDHDTETVLRKRIISREYKRLRTVQIWRGIRVLGYTPPTWVWDLDTETRNSLFERAHGVELEHRYDFIESLKSVYVGKPP